METEKKAEVDDYRPEGHIKIDWGQQGGVILGYIVALLGYYGIIANTMMFDQYGDWISFLDMDRTILFWTYTTYLENFFLPAILLFFVCFLLTYKEDIPHYGIKASMYNEMISNELHCIKGSHLFDFIPFRYCQDVNIMRYLFQRKPIHAIRTLWRLYQQKCAVPVRGLSPFRLMFKKHG